MRSYFACSLAIALLATAGCKDDHPGTDAGDAKKDGTGDGISLSDRADLGGSDRADVGTETGGGDTATEVGTETGTGTDGGDAGDGGDGGGTPTCTDGIKNSDETDIDCGGHCGKCGPGNHCVVNADCTFACGANNTCIACNAATDCPGTESECEHRTCTAGVCGSMREAAGTAPTVQTTGDCKKRVCTTAGTVTQANDDTDVPDDRNPCTNDVCTTGTPSHTMMPAGSNCGGANTCNATGQCIGCAVATDCPGSDGPCRTRTCTAGGVCGFSFTAAGTKLVDPMAKDCKGMQCDGNGNAQTVNDDLDLPVDDNPCTKDECSSGTVTYRNIQSGTLCGGSGSSLVCDGASHCVECLTASTCPGTDADCHTRSCVAGQCGVTNLAVGTLIAAQTQRDCKKTVCDGQGSTMTANDDLDLPFDSNPCTQDVCTAGTPSNPPVTAGNSCGTNTICDGQGACVTCISPSTCPGTDTDCHHRTCINGACGVANIAAGTATASMQMTGDCKVVQCDGNGQTMMVTDDTDLPVDGNACTDDICTNGTKSNPNLSTGTVCGTNLMCNGQGACVGCVTAANCGTDSFCQTRTCTNGSCGVTNTAAGTALPAAMQTDKDCKRVQCDGNGQTQTVNDDTDKPVDGNQCTKDVCTAGIPTNPPEDANATCNMSSGTRCNGTGSCVQCLQPTDCSGTDTECHHRACSSTGQCSIVNEADGKLMSGQIPADCKKNVCMNGAPAVANDDTDVLVDGNGCTMDLCSNGTRSNPPLTAGATCNEDGGTRCNGSTTAPKCVQCLMNSHCGNNDLCKMFTCDSAGQCNTNFVPLGTQVGTQVTGDCQKNVCNGTGDEVQAVDNTDVRVDGNQCTSDVCTGGNPSNPPLGAGAACNQGSGNTMCNGSATAPACVQCNQDDDCGNNTSCKTFHCNAGVCSSTNMQDGTFLSGGGAGDCHKNVCMNGVSASVPDDTDLPVDGNPCTNDVCSNGVESNPPVNVGTSCGGTQMCDGAGHCVGCVSDTDCPAAPNVCQVRVCMTGGVCGYTNEPVGSHVTNTQVGDCHHDECNGSGDVVNVIDNNDKPVDTNPCTQDVCTAGVPSNDFSTAGTACTDNSKPLATQCDGAGVCVECLNASTCPGDDTDCHARTCVNGACGISNQPEFTTATMQSATPDCHTNVCDGDGNVRNDINDLDVPMTTNDCQPITCMAGNIMATNVQVGTACAQNGGNRCDASVTSVCVPTFMVVRLGDGSVPLTNGATAVFVEERWETNGTTYRTLALPTTGSSPKPFTLSGTADAAGGLTLSTDGHYVTMAGFTSPIPTAGVAGIAASTAPRSVAMINAAGTMDTSTTLGTTAFNTDNPRSAISSNGMQFWVAGNGNSTNRGVYYSAMLGGTTTTQIESASNATRVCQIAFGQLYCDATTGSFGIFSVGSGLPTATIPSAPFFTTLTGTGDVNASYYAFAFTDANTLYVADDRVPASGGGIQKWTLSGGTWTKQGTFNTGITAGIRGLAVHTSSAGVVLIGSTASASPAPNAIVKYVDAGSFTASATTLQAATGNFVYRGVAMAPK